ncbi:fumarylacetoacetate hydrolase family protein [Frondihabitans sp. PAMC 28766]|uniref:fumarylacetoacetate hydrolase family protein n=1 Tax=Frondihabitans sp. PAMC 28766 TaxID=1795630 RepID=UPI001EF67113|nr:fumarylacetoacetate hydrolase family protein [Frondihabitans sp. PAMC 28766]
MKSAILRDGAWHVVVDPFDSLEPTGESHPVGGTTLLAPVEPGEVVGVAHNAPGSHALPIQAWLKSSRGVAGAGDSILIAPGIGNVVAEGEVAVVMGRTATALKPEDALEHVLGFTIGNDVTNVAQAAVDDKNFQSKAGVNHTPLGPWIETDLADLSDISITVSVNGREQRRSSTAGLPSSIVSTLVHITQWMTLKPGDVVLTGSPNTAAEIAPGDTVSITVEGIGTLENPVA